MNLVNQSRNANDTTWKTLESKMEGIYTNITEKINLTGASFEDFLELSITERQFYIIIVDGSEANINKSFLQPIKSMKTSFLLKESPIESLFSLTEIFNNKCLTYFSALKGIWDSVKTYSDIRIQIHNDFTQYHPIPLFNIAVHSPKIIPRYSSTYFGIQPNRQYWVKYSQLNVELLLEGFESNCAEYNIRNEYGNIRIESDCRVYCIAQIVKQKFNSMIPLTMRIIIN